MSGLTGAQSASGGFFPRVLHPSYFGAAPVRAGRAGCLLLASSTVLGFAEVGGVRDSLVLFHLVFVGLLTNLASVV